MNEATIYMTDGNEYVVEYDKIDESYTTVYFYTYGKPTNVFSKYNMICMLLKEQKNE